MEIEYIKLITPENRGLPEIGGAPIKTSHPCQKCGKPVDLLDDKPKATLVFQYNDPDGKPIGEAGFEAIHGVGLCPE